MNQVVSGFYKQFKAGTLTSESGNVEKYSRKSLTRDLVKILDEAVVGTRES
jgi:hypothetical protein